MPHKMQLSMGADTKLFTPGDKESSAYRNLRTNTTTPEAIAGREFAEKLWEEYQPYADSNFLIEIRRDFHARFWEMYLTCALLKCSLQQEYAVSCPKSKAGGPDIRIEHSGHCIWVEAVTATDGDSDKPDSIITPTLGKVYDVPDDRITLRYRTAIEQKYHKYREYRKNGIVNKGDSYIIAVNGYPLSYRWTDAEMPRILKAVFPIGALQFVFDRTTGKLGEATHEQRPKIYKITGNAVSTDCFVNDQYCGISAILHSYANACMTTLPLGLDFLVAHNPKASCGVRRGLIPVHREYWVEEGGSLGFEPGAKFCQ
jgi:hypothetical protein